MKSEQQSPYVEQSVLHWHVLVASGDVPHRPTQLSGAPEPPNRVNFKKRLLTSQATGVLPFTLKLSRPTLSHLPYRQTIYIAYSFSSLITTYG